MGYWVSQALYAIAVLGVADHLTKKAEGIDVIAAKVDADPDALYRVLRALAGVGVVAEPSPRTFALTPMSALLRTDAPGNLRAFARLQGDRWHWDSWGEIVASVRTGRPGITHARNVANCFEWLPNAHESQATFDAAMAGFAANAHAAIADKYDFSGFAHIVDVGGGRGALLETLLEHAPRAHGILFDRTAVIDSARATWAAHRLAPRLTLTAGDFFSAIPTGGDCYVLSSILHDWDDARVTRILARVVAAMAPHARVVVVEMIVPDSADDDPAKWVDLEMMLVTGGRERTVAEYRALFAQAGLALERVIPTAASVSILAARRC